MPEKNSADVSAILQKQKTAKPKMEEVIPEYLDGEMRKTALDFAAFLRAEKTPPVWTLANAWKAAYKGKALCYIRMPRGPFDNQFDQKGMPAGDRSRNFWVVTLYLEHLDEYEQTIANEGLRELVWGNLYHCNNCHPGRCAPGVDRTILGRNINNLCCGRPPVWLWNPGEAAIAGIKRLLELEKKARADDAKKV